MPAIPSIRRLARRETAVPRRALARELALLVALFVGFTVYSIAVDNVLDP